MHVLVSLLALGLMLYCLVDIVSTPASAVRVMPRLLWAIVVLFLPLLGSVAWLLAGRPLDAGLAPGSTSPRGVSSEPERPTRGGPSGGSAPRPRPRPRGPDDDPDFLRRIDEQLRRGGSDKGEPEG